MVTTIMSDLEEKCVASGLKMTDQRRIILRVLSEAIDHPSVETVYRRAKDIDATISMATVYRTLNLLDELTWCRSTISRKPIRVSK